MNGDPPNELRTPVRSPRRRSPYLLTTSSGRSLDLADPRPEDIEPEDIARALSKICRFGAQALSFYSVAQHAVEVARRVPPDLRLAGLHHDDHEAFAGDLPVPLKLLIRSESAVYDDVCARLDRAIGARLGIEPPTFNHPLIKQADEDVRVLESELLLADRGTQVRRGLRRAEASGRSSADADDSFGPLLNPAEAEAAFLATHYRLAA